MNITLLRKIKRKILQRPKQFVMTDIFSNYTEFDARPSHCGTAACIAGWAITLGDRYPNPDKASNAIYDEGRLSRAQKLLEIDGEGRELLFLEDQWPEQFQFEHAKNHPQFARLAAARIEHFIKTKGRE